MGWGGGGIRDVWFLHVSGHLGSIISMTKEQSAGLIWDQSRGTKDGVKFPMFGADSRVELSAASSAEAAG